MGEKKYLRLAVGSDLFRRSSCGSSMLLMSMIEDAVGICEGSCSCLEAGKVFGFLDEGAASGELSDVVGERIITLSIDNELSV